MKAKLSRIPQRLSESLFEHHSRREPLCVGSNRQLQNAACLCAFQGRLYCQHGVSSEDKVSCSLLSEQTKLIPFSLPCMVRECNQLHSNSIVNPLCYLSKSALHYVNRKNSLPLTETLKAHFKSCHSLIPSARKSWIRLSSFLRNKSKKWRKD